MTKTSLPLGIAVLLAGVSSAVVLPIAFQHSSAPARVEYPVVAPSARYPHPVTHIRYSGDDSHITDRSTEVGP